MKKEKKSKEIKGNDVASDASYTCSIEGKREDLVKINEIKTNQHNNFL